ncbi:MAG: arginine--tRNA ligase, partial [Deltaproteobacteria bacterium]|nr:arginine--tRNA ligase [Deltaproteobacteria bacterium]
MKENLGLMVQRAITSAIAAGHLHSVDAPPSIEVDRPKIATHGDYSMNIAMTMAASQKKAPRDIAGIIIDHVEDSDHLLSRME